jgi:hypothetical protein
MEKEVLGQSIELGDTVVCIPLKGSMMVALRGRAVGIGPGTNDGL